MATEKLTLAQRIETARKQFKPIRKDARNPHFKNEYASLDNIIDCIETALSETGVSIRNVPDVLPNGSFILRTQLVDVATGEFVEGIIPLTQGKPQDQGSAITYARRYNVSALLNLCTETDDDGNQGSGVAGGGKKETATSTPASNGRRSGAIPPNVEADW